MKRFISILISVAMLFSVAGIAVSAEVTAEEPVQTEDVEQEGDLINNIKNALSFFKYGINDIEVYLKPTDRENIEEFHVAYTENDGTKKDTFLGVYYNTKTGEVIGFNYTQGIFDSGFGYNAFDKVFFATNDCWQRALGFTPLYDLLAKIAFDYVTTRIYFDYDGKEWAIQLWKGNYAFDLFVGGEVGVYNRPAGSRLGFFYDCAGDEDMMPISIKVSDESRVYFDREPYLTWWATGFVFAEPVEPETLTMETTIQFPSVEMCQAFEKAVSKKININCTTHEEFAIIKW